LLSSKAHLNHGIEVKGSNVAFEMCWRSTMTQLKKVKGDPDSESGLTSALIGDPFTLIGSSVLT